MRSLCPPISRTILPRGAEKARTVNAPISPPSVPSPGLELRVEVPCRGEVGGAITVSLTPNSRFRHPPPSQGTCAGPGAAGAGKGRAGAGRNVYIAARRDVGAAARLRDTGRREAARVVAGSFSSSRGPRRPPAVGGTRRGAPGGALGALSARARGGNPRSAWQVRG